MPEAATPQWGESLVWGQAAVKTTAAKTFLTGGRGSQGSPARRDERRARAPKPTASRLIFGADFLRDLQTFPAPFCDYGTSDRDSPGSRGRRTAPSRPCGRRRGQRPWRALCGLAARTRGTTAHAGAVSGGDHPATRRWCTSSATPSSLPRAGRRAAGGHRNSRRSPARSIRHGGRVGAAFESRAITSGKNKKPPPTLPGSGWLTVAT